MVRTGSPIRHSQHEIRCSRVYYEYVPEQRVGELTESTGCPAPSNGTVRHGKSDGDGLAVPGPGRLFLAIAPGLPLVWYLPESSLTTVRKRHYCRSNSVWNSGCGERGQWSPPARTCGKGPVLIMRSGRQRKLAVEPDVRCDSTEWIRTRFRRMHSDARAGFQAVVVKSQRSLPDSCVMVLCVCLGCCTS